MPTPKASTPEAHGARQRFTVDVAPPHSTRRLNLTIGAMIKITPRITSTLPKADLSERTEAIVNLYLEEVARG